MARKKPLQIAVIGLGRFGANVAVTLTGLGCDVLAIDDDLNKVENISDEVTHAVQTNVTSEESLKRLGLNNFDVVVISIGGNIQSSILAALIIKEIGVKNIVAKASSELHRKALEKIGVNRVVFPEKDSGVKLAHSLTAINLVEFLEISPGFEIAEVIINNTYDGQSLRQADLRNKFGLNVLAIRNGENINASPKADDKLRKGNMIVVLGKSKDLRDFCDSC